MMELHYQVLLAFILDLIFGDPKGYPHPVRIIGSAAGKLEKWSRNQFSNETIAGTLTTLLIVSGTFLICWLLIKGLRIIHPLAETAGSVFLIYTSLSVRCMFDESRPVLAHLKENRIDLARKKLSMIVGRDTGHLDENQIRKATVESIAEGTVDGNITPLFFAFLGGAPMALAYKAVNTLDSMFGYKNDRYLKFGFAPARLDDAANWIPARLSGIFIASAALICGMDAKRSLQTIVRDGSKHLSPNAGIPEAAVAGALGVQLGGVGIYEGREVEKPLIGINQKNLENTDISATHKIMFVASILALALFIFLNEFI